MRLYAIGIYEYTQEDSPQFQLKKKAPPNKGGFSGLFSTDPLENLEKHTLKALPPEQDVTFRATYKDEYHYVKRYPAEGIVIAIVSRNKLEPLELAYLFSNIHTIYSKPNLAVTLDAIILNPLNYIARDIVTAQLKQKVQEIKEIMLENLEKLLDRGERIELLVRKTDYLANGATSFKREAKKLNGCCHW
ncbi:MAG: hypothetical protein A3E83_08095 [Gammaproteobacteria bacterium RIFCSPHIGHO2_12_FULL_41_20]|nr:MAG: hypothetical protein A3E83_08095 [Gammaproteobacteria bacterium RIFCSPHIGHO2_12_FULL_41_20]